MIEVERVLGGAPLWVAPATVIAAVAVGLSVGLGPAFLVLAGGTLLGAVMLLWSSLGRLTGESPLTLDEAIGLAAPSAEEERKRAVLRALKDLDYERSVGKISEEDYADLSARYRAEAKELLRALETGLLPLRKKAEQRLAERLKKEGLAPKPNAKEPAAGDGGTPASSAPAPLERAAPDDRPESPAAPSASPPAAVTRADVPSEPAVHECPKCHTTNEVDASFCKRCGARLSPEEAT